MEPGETRVVQVSAKPRWDHTGIRLVDGGRYRFSAEGKWRDWNNVSGAEGYPSNNRWLRLAEHIRWQRDAPWFALVGAIDHDRHTQFTISTGIEHLVDRAGELTCFANDAPLFRWNNHGDITLTVTRL